MVTKQAEITNENKAVLAEDMLYNEFLGLISLAHKPSGYSLEFKSPGSFFGDYDENGRYIANLPRKIGPLDCCFYVDHSLEKKEAKLIITGRDIEEYSFFLDKIKINPTLQYVEIGAGLGEFTPLIVSEYGDSLKHKPIVIDPADYQVMKDILKYAARIGFGDELDEKFNKWIERCEIISNPNKVTLINSTLENALSQHSWLNGIADVVTDNRGALTYRGEKSKGHILNFEKNLLKLNGELVNDLWEEEYFQQTLIY